MSDTDKEIVKECWPSARAHHDWPGKVTIRIYSNWRGFEIRGEGTNEPEAWADAKVRIEQSIERISDDTLIAFATTCSDPGLRLAAELMLRKRHPSTHPIARESGAAGE